MAGTTKTARSTIARGDRAANLQGAGNKTINRLVRLFKKQGCLSLGDISAGLQDELSAPEEIGKILSILESLDIEVVDGKEAGGGRKLKEASEQEEAGVARKQGASDSVHAYIQQIGNLPLLGREEEIAIFKRIEETRHRAREALLSAGLGARYVIGIARELMAGERRFERMVAEREVVSRQDYFQKLPGLIDATERAEATARIAWEEAANAAGTTEYKTALTRFRRRNAVLKKQLRRYCFNSKVFEGLLENLSPIVEEIRGINVSLEAARKPKKKKDSLIDPGPLKKRLQEIESEFRIEPEELVRVVSEARQATREAHRAKTEMVEANLRLVISIAKKYAYREVPFLDLIQEGNLGLMKAVERFEYRRGYKFSTYATWWIRQGITRSIAQQSRTIRIPVHVVDIIHKMVQVQRRLVQERGREPSKEEVAEEMGLAGERVRALLRMTQQPISLETPVGENGDTNIGDFIEEENAEDPHEVTAASFQRETIDQVLESLSESERKVLSLRFGLLDGYSRTLEEVGRKFDVTRERIRQIESKALRKMRHPARIRQLGGCLESARSDD